MRAHPRPLALRHLGAPRDCSPTPQPSTVRQLLSALVCFLATFLAFFTPPPRLVMVPPGRGRLRKGVGHAVDGAAPHTSQPGL